MGELLIHLGDSISGWQSKMSVQESAAVGQSTGTETPTATSVLPAAPPGVSDPPGSAAQKSEANEGKTASSTAEQAQFGADEAQTAAGASSTLTDASAPRSDAPPSAAPADAKEFPDPTRPSDVTFAGSDNGEIELAQARRYLQVAGTEDSAVAAQLLWVAIGKGNSQAEVELADLYLRGQGAVKKNCERARILLMAAHSNHSVEAGEWLAYLRDHGCR